MIDFVMSPTMWALFPSPYIVIESTLARGSATARATSGSARKYISRTAAWFIFVIATAFFSRPSASAVSFAPMAAASARPRASMPWASASIACLSASAFFVRSKASASASRWRVYRAASAFFSAA